MSRGQENQIINTSTAQNATAAGNAQQSYQAAQGDITNYQDQLAKFAASNPYGAGGAYQTAMNQSTANTADAASQAAAQAMQAKAVRSGQNAGSGIAAGLEANQANTRDLMAEQAKQNAARMAAGAGYGKEVLGAAQVPATLEAGLSGQQLGEESNALKTGEEAAGAVPGFWDTMGNSFAKSLGNTAGGGNLTETMKLCWIAARLYGGWSNPRTIIVRTWLNAEFAQGFWGGLVMAIYGRFGRRIADEWMPQSKMLTRALKWVFDRALKRAAVWMATPEGQVRADQFLGEVLRPPLGWTPMVSKTGEVL